MYADYPLPAQCKLLYCILSIYYCHYVLLYYIWKGHQQYFTSNPVTGLEDCFNVLLLKLHRDRHIASHLLGENNTDQTTLDIMYKCIWFCQTAVRKPLQQLYNCCCKSFKETLRKSE